ncbi:hypothetical protein BH20ACT15_BH20ACT15_14590 [soil metagenome]
MIGYGGVWDGQLPEESGALAEDERIQFLFEEDEPRIKALMVHEPFEIDPGELDSDEIWSEDIGFDVPQLGLMWASVGELILAVQGRFRPDEPTMDVAYFQMAVAAADDLEHAADLWKLVIECGDMKGHFGLGYTLHDLGRFRDAYGHLRFYTWLTPHNAWAWCWLGKACEGIGERTEALDAYRRAAEMEELGGLETDAPDRLRELEEIAWG